LFFEKKNQNFCLMWALAAALPKPVREQKRNATFGLFQPNLIIL
jgi:hypothetical protein